MKVLYFTNPDIEDEDLIPSIIRLEGDECVLKTDSLSLEWVIENKIDFIVSDRSRSLIKEDLIKFLPKRIINLHPSYLPWGRGYNPNYWSIKEGSPFGVTLHYIDKDIDSGNILAQTRIFYDGTDTLRTTYDRLRFSMVGLFRLYWPLIKLGKLPSQRQDIQSGSIHYKREFEKIFPTLRLGWDTPINDVTRIN